MITSRRLSGAIRMGCRFWSGEDAGAGRGELGFVNETGGGKVIRKCRRSPGVECGTVPSLVDSGRELVESLTCWPALRGDSGFPTLIEPRVLDGGVP